MLQYVVVMTVITLGHWHLKASKETDGLRNLVVAEDRSLVGVGALTLLIT